MDINVQIFTGGCVGRAAINAQGRAVSEMIEAETNLQNKLRAILKRTRITNALIGWDPDADMSKTVSLLKDAGADVYLWLPVFSDLDGLAFSDPFSPLIGADGKVIDASYGAAGSGSGCSSDGDSGGASGGEAFNFCCPSDPRNVDRFIRIFEKHYEKKQQGMNYYDGVFLDKIRYPSFVGGKQAVYSCYCGYCVPEYGPPDPASLAENEGANPFGITEYTGLRYTMAPAFYNLFEYKREAVFRSLTNLCAYFRKRGYKIGLDLFAPFLSHFVGQDYHKLLTLADFVKPMFYGVTDAPAGLPFEVARYAAAYVSGGAGANQIKTCFSSITGYGGADFIAVEIAGIKKIINAQNLHTKLYAGIEINDTDVSPVTPGYILRSAAGVKEADGVVASWDLNRISIENINCLLDAIYS